MQSSKEEVKQELKTPEDKREKIKKNKTEIKLTNLANVAMTALFVGLGLGAFFFLKDATLPLFSEAGKLVVRVAFAVVASAATVMSNSWAIQRTVDLNKENKKLSYEAEKQEFLGKIAEFEGKALTQQEIKELKTPINQNVATTSQSQLQNDFTKTGSQDLTK